MRLQRVSQMRILIKKIISYGKELSGSVDTKSINTEK